MNKTALIESLNIDSDFIPATMGLYEGRLVKNETELFFIAERFSGWEIMERCERSDVQKVEVSESFMGVVVEIHTNGSHWVLKELPENTTVQEWVFERPSPSTAMDLGRQPADNLRPNAAEHPQDPGLITRQSTAKTVVETAVEVYPEDIQKMRKYCEMDPSFEPCLKLMSPMMGRMINSDVFLKDILRHWTGYRG